MSGQYMARSDRYSCNLFPARWFQTVSEAAGTSFRRKRKQDVSALGAFFRPESVAVIGASSDPKRPGNTTLRNMISMGYKGKLFPVNPREKTILGLPCYKSVLDIPEPVELCVLLIAAELTVLVAKELAERQSR